MRRGGCDVVVVVGSEEIEDGVEGCDAAGVL